MGRMHPGRVLYHLKSIKGYFNCVPRDIAPNEDKGIYFAKAMDFLESLITEYQKKVDIYREDLLKKGSKSGTEAYEEVHGHSPYRSDNKIENI